MVPKFLTVAEAAKVLNVSTHTIRAWLAQRRLTHVRLGRAIRIPAAKLDRFVAGGTVPAERRFVA